MSCTACLTGVMFMFMFFETQPNTRKAALQLGKNVSLGGCFCIFTKCMYRVTENILIDLIIPQCTVEYVIYIYIYIYIYISYCNA